MPWMNFRKISELPLTPPPRAPFSGKYIAIFPEIHDKLVAPAPFEIFPKIHPFWRKEASLNPHWGPQASFCCYLVLDSISFFLFIGLILSLYHDLLAYQTTMKFLITIIFNHFGKKIAKQGWFVKSLPSKIGRDQVIAAQNVFIWFPQYPSCFDSGMLSRSKLQHRFSSCMRFTSIQVASLKPCHF